MLIRVGGNLNGKLYGPATIKSLSGGAWAHSRPCDSYGLSNCHFFPPVRYPSASALIVVLLTFCRPIAIVWLVASVVVSSLYCVHSRWSWPHIRVKSLEALHPSIAYRNAASAILDVVRIFRICASLAHGRPGSIFTAFRHSMDDGAGRIESSNTSARIRLSRAQDAAERQGCVPARALTVPSGVAVAVARPLAQYSKFTKDQPGQVLERSWKSAFSRHIAPRSVALWHPMCHEVNISR